MPALGLEYCPPGKRLARILEFDQPKFGSRMLNRRTLCVIVGMFLSLQGTAFAEPLITAAEAALPPAPASLTTRGISRGPGVKLVSPVEDAAVKAPFDFKVAFEPRGGSKIDTKSVKAVYLKTPSVDLTPRLQSAITETGVSLSATDVPPGEHDIKFTVLDSDGRETNSVVHLVVTQ